jgi:hypothetical protein
VDVTPAVVAVRVTRRVLGVLLLILFGFLVGELVLRAVGFRRWQSRATYAAETPAPLLTAPDPELGWVNRPGVYHLPPITITIRADGARSAEGATPPTPSIAAFGCSFTYGYGVDDTESWPARLRAVNFGVPGFSTLQSMQLWRRQRAVGLAPRAVVYGWLEDHLSRNVATAGWLYELSVMATHPEHVAVPYVTLQEGVLRSGTARYPSWPFQYDSAVLTLAAFDVAKLTGWRRTADPEGVASMLLAAFAEDVRSSGSRFLAVNLAGDPDTFARLTHGIDAVDCRHPRYPAPDTLVTPGDSHPNAGVHAHYAACIAAHLGERT